VALISVMIMIFVAIWYPYIEKLNLRM